MSAAALPMAGGTTAADPRLLRARPDARKFALLAAQLAALLAILHGFDVEGPVFLRLAAWCFAAFGVHYFLPLRMKKAAFVALSLLGGVVVLAVPGRNFGWRDAILAAGACVAFTVVVGLCFYGFFSLRARFAWRLAFVAALVGALAWARHALLLPEPFWYVIGAVFMLRIILYAHEVRVEREPQSLTDFMSYFFLLPNFFFPFFPVVDYHTFKKGFFAEDIHVTAQRGIAWIVRGTLHLLLYRIVYHRLLIGPDDVRSLPTLLQWLFPTFWLYLKISGQFHVIVGMLHLFGWSLPPANRYYLLATSFSDLWKRINIYWKEFMVKVVYYPVFFPLRRKNETVATIAAVAAVFLVTTLLHAWHLFWMRGVFSIALPEVIFWSVLGVLVLVTVLRDQRRGKPKPRGRAAGLALRVASIAAVQVTLVLLWSLWMSPSLSSWWDVVTWWS